MEHPYNIQPIGNIYRNKQHAKVVKKRFESLGTFLCQLKDEIIYSSIFVYFDANDLGIIAPVSNYFYVLSHDKDYWKSLVLDKYGGAYTFYKTWKDTYVKMLGKTHPVDNINKLYKAHKPIKVAHIYSDILFRSHFCTVVPIQAKWVEINNIDRIDGNNLSVKHFQQNYEQPREPVILTNIVKQWACHKKWNWEYLRKMYPNNIHAGGYTFKMSDYIEYMKNSNDEQPLYIFDKKFAEKTATINNHGNCTDISNDYTVPSFFAGENDLFSLLGEEKRPDYRWLIAGPARSGSSFHIDPNGTNAWNAVIKGKKKWIMFPPHIVPPGVYPTNDGGDVATPVTLIEWLLNFYDYAREMGARECICYAGEIVYVPQGWWHLVLNLEDGIAITQNYVSKSNLKFCLNFLKTKPDLVSGLAHERRKSFYDEFVKVLKENKEEIYKEFIQDVSNIKSVKYGKNKIMKCNQLSKILTATSSKISGEDNTESHTVGESKSSFSFNFF
eukprot:g2382.t1